MKIGDKKNLEKKQVLIMTVVIGVVIVILFKIFFYDTITVNIQNVDVKLKETMAKLEDANSIADRKELVDKEMAMLQHKLSSTGEMLPQKKEIPKFLKTIISRANDNSIRMITFQPTAIIPHEFYNEVPVSVNVSSSFNNLGRFFAKIGNLNRIVNVENVQLSAALDKESRTTLSASFILKTFTYNEGGVN